VVKYTEVPHLSPSVSADLRRVDDGGGLGWVASPAAAGGGNRSCVREGKIGEKTYINRRALGPIIVSAHSID
jgi:hypothetical protein